MEDDYQFKGKKALLVEDNEMNIQLFSILLRKAKLEFDYAMNGEDGINLFNANIYHIVLTDIHLPNFYGDELAKRIRKNEDTVKANIPIIALTASISENEVDKYLESGINKILLKPFTPAIFNQTLKEYLQ